MKTKLNIVLFLILAAGAFILLRPAGKGVEIAKPLFEEKFVNGLKEVLLKRESGEIHIVRVTAPTKLRVGHTLVPPEIEVMAPSPCSASEEAVTRLSVALRMLTPRNSIDKPEPSFGLDHPEYMLTLKSEFGEQELTLGKEHPFSGRRYAQLKGIPDVLLLDDAIIRPVLDAEFCDRTPLKVPLSSILGVKIERSSGTPIELRHTEKSWQFDSGEAADRQLVDFALEQFLTQKFLESVTPAVDGGSPLGNVTLKLKPDAPAPINSAPVVEKISIARSEAKALNVLIAGAAVTYSFEEPAGRILLLKPDDLKDRALFAPLKLAELNTLCIETAGAENSKQTISIEGFPPCESPANKTAVLSREEIARRFEQFRILSFETLPGRLLSKDQPQCELNGTLKDGGKLRFAVLEEVESMVEGRQKSPEAQRPREYLFDSGPIHARGIVSAEMADLLCSNSK